MTGDAACPYCGQRPADELDLLADACCPAGAARDHAENDRLLRRHRCFVWAREVRDDVADRHGYGDYS